MPSFRRRLSGETDLLTLNQYTLPDLHVLCTSQQAPMAYAAVLREAATCRLLFGETGAQFLEISPELFVGRALAGWAEREIPVGFGGQAVTVLPVTDDDVPSAVRTVNQLRAPGVPAGLGEGGSRSVGSRMHRLRQQWYPYSAVVGRREAGGEPLALMRISTREVSGVQAFMARHEDVLIAVSRGRADQSHVPSRTDLPYR